MDKPKLLGQVFTPAWVVRIILDNAGYTGSKILTKKILEPSAGKGAFLTEIVKRYIEEAKKANWSITKLKASLEEYIVGIEFEKEVFQKCIHNLDLIAKESNILEVKWRLMNMDALKYKDTNESYDFVVGNPPYIRVHNLGKEVVDYLKNNYMFCRKGMIDIYLAFFELGLKLLNDKGVLVYITPNMFLRNASNKDFRNFLVENNLLDTLINFGSYPIFENINTYNCITKLNKGSKKTFLDYYVNQGQKIKRVNRIEPKKYLNERFVFTTKEDEQFIFRKKIGKPLGELANIQYGFATMRDKIYITGDIRETKNNKLVLFNGELVEKELLKDIVKGSRIFFKNKLRKEKIIFPYKRINSRWVVISEEEMQTRYKHTYNYLCKNQKELKKRNMDRRTLWYEYGRSQGVQSIHQPKLVVDILMNGRITLSYLEKDVMVYSGIFITEKMLPIKMIQEEIAKEDFYNFARILGKDMQGGYKSITTKIIKSYAIEYA